MKDIEIPLVSERGKRYRFFEMLPGLLSWSILIAPFALSLVSARLTALFIIVFFLTWFARAIGLNVRVLQGWHTMQIHKKLDWPRMLLDLKNPQKSHHSNNLPKWHYQNLERLTARENHTNPDDVIHAVIIAAYNEDRDILEPTIQSLLSSHYDMKKVILVIAYEGRDGAQSEKAALALVDEYGTVFKHAKAVKHPLTPNEV